MKPQLLLLLSPLLTQTLVGQMDIPGNPMVEPKGFKTRAVGGGTNTGATVQAVEKPVRHVAHIVLFETRMWSSTEGKPLEAKLIAFEDLVAEAPPGATPEMPAPPARPTVIRNQSIRLLVGKKAVLVALERLSEADLEFVSGIEEALARKAESPR
ncbi:MAG: hypothetical protein V4640_11460 [Verrucomicrobiota bacterium]